VNLSAEQQVQIAHIAAQSGTDPERLVAEVVARYLDGEARFALEKGKTTAGHSEFVEEVDARGLMLPTRHRAGGIITPQ
jgi:hypothetical protein